MPPWVRVLPAQVWDSLPSCETCVSQCDGMWLHMELWTKIYPSQREHGIANRLWIAAAVMPLSWCSFWRETEVDSRAVAAPGKDCSTTIHSCLAKCGSLLPRGQRTEQMLSERHVPLMAWLPAGKLLTFSESALRDFMCLSRMVPTISQRLGERSEGKTLTIVLYKGVVINLTHCFWRRWWDLELAAGAWWTQFSRRLFRDEKKNVFFFFFFLNYLLCI